MSDNEADEINRIDADREQDECAESDDDNDDDFEDVVRLNRRQLEVLKSLRKNVNWDVKVERRKFLRNLYPRMKKWKRQISNLTDVFRREEIELLLLDSVEYWKSREYEFLGKRFVRFMARSGYKDVPDVDADGEPVTRRATPLHLAAARPKDLGLVRKLFKIYNRFDVNYSNECGLTHLHVACTFGLDDIVKEFLELGQNPNCVMQKNDAVIGCAPLHVAAFLKRANSIELLLKNGANPNLVDDKGWTPLHIICARQSDDFDLAKLFFEIKSDKHQMMQVDAKDNEGWTPLYWAVTRLLPNVVQVLLNNGADTSSFIFPTESDFVDTLEVRSDEFFHNNQFINDYKLRLASSLLVIVENLEEKGYELDRSDALTIMAFFDKHEVFVQSSDDIEKCWFASKAKNLMLKPKLSLYDLIKLRPKEAPKQLTYKDYLEIARSNKLSELSVRARKACTAHMCETMSRGFYRRWALEAFLELTCHRLPILCCYMIVERLTKEDSRRICLAATDQSHEYVCNTMSASNDEFRVSFKKDDCDSEEMIPHYEETLKRLKSASQNVNWDSRNEIFEFLHHHLYPLIITGKGHIPNLLNVFQKKQIDRLLTGDTNRVEPFFIKYVIDAGYRDEPDLDEGGKPILRRNTVIHDAAMLRNFDCIPDLFKIYNRFDLDYIDEYDVTHFQAACISGCEEAVEKFLEHGQDPNFVPQEVAEYAEPPVHLAMEYGRKEVLELLLRRGADPNVTNKDGLTPLLYVCKLRYDDYEVVEMFFEICDVTQKAVQVDARDDSGKTALHWSVVRGHENIVESLLKRSDSPKLTPRRVTRQSIRDTQRRVKVNAVDNYGQTPLHLAVEGSNERIIELLLRNGADPNFADEEGYAPLQMICQRDYGTYDFMKLFFEINDDLNQKVLVDAPDIAGGRALQSALIFYCNETAGLLLRRGADPNLACWEDGSAPLHIICNRDYDYSLSKVFFEVTDELNLQVQVDARNYLGRTPLQLAVATILPETVDILLNRGADLSKFIFPTESHVCEESKLWYHKRNSKLIVTSGALAVLDTLEKRGYVLKQSDAYTIMKLLAKHEVFDNSEDFYKCYFDVQFVVAALQIKIRPDVSLFQVLQPLPKEQLTYLDYFKFGRSDQLWKLPCEHIKTCVLYLCEKISRRFFRRWTVEFFMSLTRYRLPILCCDSIIGLLVNEDLYHICVAATDQINEDSKIVIRHNPRPLRVRKAPKKLQY
ncbi:unnamed protein product [Trichogramma brassicae]|uniref:SOCS box domain-containing protein n=1 Tax=Trichogramma brassicae TaxID=86971 RepID=A0A6H5IUE6_9HYME|nr:unnamed protein product [Trichogramma brassicae]